MNILEIISKLCGGDPRELSTWFDGSHRRERWTLIVLIIVGSGIYGATIGAWRSPLQGFYVFIKFPVLILLTTCGNALINGMIAQLLGTGITFKQSFSMIVMSFAIASAIMISLSPFSLFIVLSAPPLGTPDAWLAHHIIILFDVVIIAFAGIVANTRLFQLIRHLTGSVVQSRRVLFSWLTVNLLLGSQLSWIMRPFIGTPSYPVEFFRETAFDGNFFEAIYLIIKNFL